MSNPTKRTRVIDTDSDDDDDLVQKTMVQSQQPIIQTQSDSLFIIQDEAKGLESFLSKLMKIVEEAPLQIQYDDSTKERYISTRVVHPSKVCMLYIKYKPLKIHVLSSLSTPTVTINVKNLLLSVRGFSETTVKLTAKQDVIETELQNKNSKLMINTPLIETESHLASLENLAQIKQKIQASITIPLSTLKLALQIAANKQLDKISFTLVKPKNQSGLLFFGVFYSDSSYIWHSLSSSSSAPETDASLLQVELCDTTIDFNSLDMNEMDTVLELVSFPSDYLKKFVDIISVKSVTLEFCGGQTPLLVSTSCANSEFTFILAPSA